MAPRGRPSPPKGVNPHHGDSQRRGPPEDYPKIGQGLGENIRRCPEKMKQGLRIETPQKQKKNPERESPSQGGSQSPSGGKEILRSEGSGDERGRPHPQSQRHRGQKDLQRKNQGNSRKSRKTHPMPHKDRIHHIVQGKHRHTHHGREALLYEKPSQRLRSQFGALGILGMHTIRSFGVFF